MNRHVLNPRIREDIEFTAESLTMVVPVSATKAVVLDATDPYKSEIMTATSHPGVVLYVDPTKEELFVAVQALTAGHFTKI